MIGEVIHDYRIERALTDDKGGMGDVFLAVHVHSRAEAVVKVLKAELSAHRDVVTRFFNEARAAAQIQHPGIVAVYNVGYHRDRAFLLMERLRGEDLETRLRRGPLAVAQALTFLRQAAGAIGAAHAVGIVHRDLKPANLFVVPDPEVIGGERIRVLDFGIAKLSQDAGTLKTQGVFGTPAYMAPEQCSSTRDVDARADLYALGCILYEMLSGTPPFGHGGVELVAAHLRDEPVPLRRRAPHVPDAVEALTMRLLQKDRAQRLPSCEALVEGLNALVGSLGGAITGPMNVGVPVGARGAATTLGAASGQATAARSRRGVWAGAGAAIVAVAAIVTGVAVLGGSSVPPAAIAADVPAPPTAQPVDAAPAAAPVQPPEPGPEPGPAPPKAEDCPDEVACLLADRPPACCAKYGKRGGAKAGGAKAAELPLELDRASIAASVRAVRPRVEACGAKAPGNKVTVTVKVEPSGAIASASVRETTNEPLGACVLDVVKGARFPKTQIGGSFSYPFIFR